MYIIYASYSTHGIDLMLCYMLISILILFDIIRLVDEPQADIVSSKLNIHLTNELQNFVYRTQLLFQINTT